MTPSDIEALEKVRDALAELCAINKGAGYEALNQKGREALSLLPDLIARAKDGGWQDIASAPKDGTIFYAMMSQDFNKDDLHGEKQGWLSLPRLPFLCRWNKDYYEDMPPAEAGEFVEVDKWGADDSDCSPALWQPLPTPPKPEQPE